ncbi:MAG TPA: hypothetical protein VHS35_02260 [Pseudonocardia sp.]|jgi:hypothetical protein|nr:hypothetical protein [Pseudonocardia sp.]
MPTRRILAIAAAALPAAVLVACSAAPNPAPAAPAAPAKDTAAACTAEVALNATIPPGADPDGPAPSAAEMQTWATTVAGPFATLRDNAPDSLQPSVAVLGGVLDQAKQGQRIDVSDPKITAASNAVDGWVHDNCGFQTLDLTSTGGKLGPAPTALKPGPVSIKFSSTGDPSAFVLLLARVKDGQKAAAADVDAGRADFDTIAEVVGAAQPTGAGPAYGTATVTAGHYLLTSPLGTPPNFAGTASLDVTVG